MGDTREWGTLNLEGLPEVPRVVKYRLAPAWEHDFHIPRDLIGGRGDTRSGTAQTCREASAEFMRCPPAPVGGGLGGEFGLF